MIQSDTLLKRRKEERCEGRREEKKCFFPSTYYLAPNRHSSNIDEMNNLRRNSSVHLIVGMSTIKFGE